MTDFNEFKRLVEEAGMTAHRCTQYHWQINGGIVQVNWWPSSERMNAKGSTGRSLPGSVALAIALAKPISAVEPPEIIGRQDAITPDSSVEAGGCVPYELQYVRDDTTRTVAWIALICGTLSLLLSIGRFICDIW